MSETLIRDRVDDMMEGELLPEHAAPLRQVYPAQITACFLGYGAIAPAEKAREIRAHASHPNDWPQKRSDAELLAIIEREIDFSRTLRAECARYEFPYFDTSRRFLAAVDDVVASMRST